jgi:hypothetical protein
MTTTGPSGLTQDPNSREVQFPNAEIARGIVL